MHFASVSFCLKAPAAVAGFADDAADGNPMESRGGADTLQAYLAANYTHLLRRLTRHLGCADLASDCLHDAWLRLGERERAPAQMVQSPEAYIYRVACNVAMDRMRAERPWQYSGNADGELEQIVDASPGPELIAEARSDLAAVDRAMQRLPRRHQSILLALRVHEMTREEVGKRIDLSLRRVDTVLRQALDHCAEHLGRPEGAGVGVGRRALR